MINSGFIFQNPHRHVAVLDVPMLEKEPCPTSWSGSFQQLVG